ncbi:MAG TPA: hypothetical protein VFE38_06095 [Edaphobacter sp.]|nr:hypothetical protein [Edaphobacter sp.]
MSTLHTSPAYIRQGGPVTNQHRGSLTPQQRPYLIAGQKRKQPAPAKQSTLLFPHESEDARLTGCTRSLYRRLLALNLPGSAPRIQAYPETAMASSIKIA